MRCTWTAGYPPFEQPGPGAIDNDEKVALQD